MTTVEWHVIALAAVVAALSSALIVVAIELTSARIARRHPPYPTVLLQDMRELLRHHSEQLDKMDDIDNTLLHIENHVRDDTGPIPVGEATEGD